MRPHSGVLTGRPPGWVSHTSGPRVCLLPPARAGSLPCRKERATAFASLVHLKPTQSKDRRKTAYWAWTDDVNNGRQSFMLVTRVRSSLQGQGGSSSPPPALEVSPPRVGCVWGMVFAHLARPHCLLFTVLAVALKCLFPDFTHSLGRGIGYPPRLKTYSLFI